MNRIHVEPITLSDGRLTLQPLTMDHESGLRVAAADGSLWNIRVSNVPEPDNTRQYLETALKAWESGNRLPFVVINADSQEIIGTTSYHDILPNVGRVEIGFTWYAKSWQRSHVNTTAKLLLLTHAFETLGCSVVGWRTDNFNYASQRAIERLGAHKDGVIRSHGLRRDGTTRDTVMYSLLKGEWPEVKAQLLYLLAHHKN